MRRLTAIVLVVLGACGEPSTLPDADYWVGPVGVVVEEGSPSWVGSESMNSELAQIVTEVEAVTGQSVAPLVVFLMPGTLDCGRPQYACYVYGADSGQVSVGFELEGYGTFAPRCLRETYLPKLVVEHERVKGHVDCPSRILSRIDRTCN